MSRSGIIALLAAFCVAAAARATELATLTVATSADTISVTVPAGALDDTSQLYLAYAASDYGDNPAAWPAANRVVYSGAISTAAATYEFDRSDVPDGMVVRAFATSGIRLIDGWVKLQAYQYIDTGIADNTAYGVVFKFRPISASTGGDYASVIGSGLDQFTIGMYNSFNLYYLRYGGNNDNTGGDGYSTTANGFVVSDITVPHVFAVTNGVSSLDGNAILTTLNSGTQAKKGSPSGVLAKTGKTVLLGTSWVKTGTDLSGRYCHGEWHYARLLNSSGSSMVDLVPALRGDTSSSEAGFYDTVSGEFFAKSGTGGALEYDTSASVTNTIAKLAAVSDAVATGMTAYWTGGGDRETVNDPANWACTNAAGEEVASTYPDIHTFVRIDGATTFNVPAGQTLSCAKISFRNASLAADCDWSGLASAVVPTSSSAHTALDYLEAPAGTYIDTGFKPNQDTRIVLDITVKQSPEYWFGAWNTAYNDGAYSVCNDNKNVYVGYGSDGGGKFSALANGRYTIDFNKRVLYIDGATKYTTTNSTFQVNYNLYLFGQNRKGTLEQRTGQNIRLHSCKIYDNGTLVRDYVPVIKDGVVCLYDNAQGEYVYNAGTGSFTAGPSTGVLDFIEMDSAVDLAGHTLTLTNSMFSGSLTSTVAGGTLAVYAASGTAVTNKALSLTGSLAVKKTGAGTFLAAVSNQTYTGGTYVDGGIVQCGAFDGALGPHKALVTVADGAAFDWAGMAKKSATTTAYSFNIAGTGIGGSGAIYSSVVASYEYWYQTKAIADLELSADASIGISANDGAVPGFNSDGETHSLTFNGHTLTILHGVRMAFVRVTATDAGTIKNVNPSGAAVVTMGRGISVFGGDYLTDLGKATLDVGVGCAINAENKFALGTLIDRRSVRGGGYDHAITILDRYVPMTTNHFHSLILGDATHTSPVLDLSNLAEPFVVGDTYNFAPTCDTVTVSVHIGERSVSVGDKIVSWETMPEFDFAMDADATAQNLAVVSRADGLYVKNAAVPEYAVWDLEAETPGWVFYDSAGSEIAAWTEGVTEDMQVRFSSYAEYAAIAAQGVTPAAYVLTSGFTLPEGEGLADMTTGFDFEFTEGVTIDAYGRTLKLPAAMIGGDKAFTVTSSAAGGTLLVDVASGDTLTNTKMTLTGSIAVVKTGAGTFTASKTGQTYTGGTVVSNGWIKSGVSSGPWGASRASITVVDTGAAMDWNGVSSASATPYNLTIKGTGIDNGGAIVFRDSATYNGYCLGDLTLSGDALIVDARTDVGNHYCGFVKDVPHLLTLNGHTLTIDAGCKFNFCRTTSDAGTIKVVTTKSGSYYNRMASFWDGPIDLSAATLDLADGITLNDDTNNNISNLVVGTFIDRRTLETYFTAGNDGMTVLDCFKPMATNLLQKVLLGNAAHLNPVLDLSELDGPLVILGDKQMTGDSGATTVKAGTLSLSAAEGARVMLRLGDRRVSARTPVLTWETEEMPASLSGVAFGCGDTTRRYAVTVRGDGVYVRSGMVLTFR